MTHGLPKAGRTRVSRTEASRTPARLESGAGALWGVRRRSVAEDAARDLLAECVDGLAAEGVVGGLARPHPARRRAARGVAHGRRGQAHWAAERAPYAARRAAPCWRLVGATSTYTATAYNANYASAVYYVRALLALGRPASALFLIGHNLPGAVPALTSAF